MTANSQVIPQRTKWPQNSLGKKVVCSTDTAPTVVCERKDSSMSDVFIILLRIPSSSLVFFTSEASTVYSTTAPQTSSSCRQASSYFQELLIPCVSEFCLSISLQVPSQLSLKFTLQGLGAVLGTGSCSVVSNSNRGHLPPVLWDLRKSNYYQISMAAQGSVPTILILLIAFF